jgi:transposase
MSDTELTSMPEPARRVEIFTGAGRRRVWPPGVKAAIIAEIGVDGATVSAVARRHGLTAGQLFAWRREARRAAAGSGFVPVLREPPSTASALLRKDRRERRRALPDEAPIAVVEVVVGGAVMRVLPAADERTIAAVLAAMKSVR